MTQTPSIYLRNKTIQESYRFQIINGTGYYIVNGERVPREVIETPYPMASIIDISFKRPKGESPDTRTNWRK